jgi:hypothetical protein
MHDWCLQLVADDYKKFTDNEWKMFFFVVATPDKIVDFVNEVVASDPEIILHILAKIKAKTHHMKYDTEQTWKDVMRYVKI